MLCLMIAYEGLFEMLHHILKTQLKLGFEESVCWGEFKHRDNIFFYVLQNI